MMNTIKYICSICRLVNYSSTNDPSRCCQAGPALCCVFILTERLSYSSTRHCNEAFGKVCVLLCFVLFFFFVAVFFILSAAQRDNMFPAGKEHKTHGQTISS